MQPMQRKEAEVMTKSVRFMAKCGATVVAAAFLAALAPTVAPAEDTATLYKKKCASCHGVSGKGDGPAGKMLKPPAGDFATVLKGQADADIAKVIKEGGKGVGKSAMMPAFGSSLSDDQIQALVEHAKGLASK